VLPGIWYDQFEQLQCFGFLGFGGWYVVLRDAQAEATSTMIISIKQNPANRDRTINEIFNPN
jgi:hypothetical protein